MHSSKPNGVNGSDGRGLRLALVGLPDNVVDDVRTASPPGWIEVASEASPRGVAARLAPHGPDAVLMHAGPGADHVWTELPELRRLVPGCRILLLSEVKDPDQILRAMREGASEYIVLPEDLGELARCLADLASTRGASGGGSHPVIAVVGASGGVGTTTFAVHLAGEMNARRPSHVALVDVNPVAPDVGVVLDVELPFSLLDVMRNVHRLDDTLLHGVVNRHPTGLAVVALPEDEEARAEIARLGTGAPLRALEVLRRSFEAVVLDCGSVPDPYTAPLAASADRVLLVVHASMVSLKNALRRLEWLKSSGVRGEAISVVVNRHGGRSARLKDGDIEESLGCAIVATLPSDSAVGTALDDGRLLAAEKSLTPLRRELARLSEPWLAPPARAPRKLGIGLFARLFA